MAIGQLSLIEESGPANPPTEVRLGHHSAQIPLQKKRRDACNRLMGILDQLEGKDVYIGSYDIGGRHFWVDTLKLGRMRLEYFPLRLKSDINYIPDAIVLWGNRSGQVRIFTDYLVDVWEHEYFGYWEYTLSFQNGFWANPLDPWKSHNAHLEITRFKD